MGLTHIIRAEEHLSNTPKQIMAYRYLGWDLPEFAHVSMILAPDRSKLSKRHGATSVQEFRDQGFLPEAIVNYIAFLGWSPEGEHEVMPLDDMVKQFSLERVNPTAAIYDVKKLTWMNGIYMRTGDLDRLTDMLVPFMIRAGVITEAPDAAGREHLKQIVAAARDRAKTLVELADVMSYFYQDDYTYDEKGVRKHFAGPLVAALLREAIGVLEALPEFTVTATEAAYREFIERKGISGGELIHPTRLAITGRTVGPSLFDVMSLLGRDRTLARMNRAASFIEGNCQA
jgi:glutamyl-tRNA synthetase